jgi:uncharacterized protein
MHHVTALAWLDRVQGDGDVILCRLSQLGLLRLLNNPVVMGADVQSGSEAWKTWDELLADQRSASTTRRRALRSTSAG